MNLFKSIFSDDIGMGGLPPMFQIGRIFIAIVMCIIVFKIVQSIIIWFKNNNSPVIKIAARVVSKRTSTSSSNNGHASTYYYVTFENEKGKRMELSVRGLDYGMMAEGDFGNLAFQGTRFLSFDRNS